VDNLRYHLPAGSTCVIYTCDGYVCVGGVCVKNRTRCGRRLWKVPKPPRTIFISSLCVFVVYVRVCVFALSTHLKENRAFAWNAEKRVDKI